jgi:hypothetical protein
MFATQSDNVTTGPDMLCLDAQICFPLYAATNLLGRAYRPLLEPLGLTYSQYLVMLALWQAAPVYVAIWQSGSTSTAARSPLCFNALKNLAF